jgi:hypothetical protein
MSLLKNSEGQAEHLLGLVTRHSLREAKHRARILLMEDNAVNRTWLCGYLRNEVTLFRLR